MLPSLLVYPCSPAHLNKCNWDRRAMTLTRMRLRRLSNGNESNKSERSELLIRCINIKWNRRRGREGVKVATRWNFNNVTTSSALSISYPPPPLTPALANELGLLICSSADQRRDARTQLKLRCSTNPTDSELFYPQQERRGTGQKAQILNRKSTKYGN